MIRVLFAVGISWFLFLFGFYDYAHEMFDVKDSIAYELLFEIFNNQLGFHYRKAIDISVALSYVAFVVGVYVFNNLLKAPFKWGKYTKVLNEMEDRFNKTVNFHLPNEHKNLDVLPSIAFTIIFEEARKNYYSPEQLIELLKPIAPSNNLAHFVNPTKKHKLVEWGAYKSAYEEYINYRSKEFSPLVSSIAAFQKIENPLQSDDEVRIIEEDLIEDKILSKDSGLV